MEDWVNSHGTRKIKSIRRSTNLTNHGVGTEATNIELGGWTNRPDVASQEPHFSTWEECGCWPTTTIG